MLGQSSLGIGLTMFLRDQFSGPAARIRKSAGMTSLELRKMQEEQLRYQRNLYAGLAMAGAMAVRGITKSIKRGAEFGYEMEFVKSITSATRQEAQDLGALAKKLGQDTMFFSQDVAEGMRFMGMAGMEAIEIKKNIGAAVALAGSTKSQIGGKGGAADIMTNIMKAFQVEAKYSADVADVLSYATTRANTNLFDLGEALKYAGSTAMDLEVSLQEATAMTMALGNAGMQGSMAGVAMENAMRYLARATGAFGSGTQKKALSMIGMSKADVTDAKGDLLSMTEVIKATGEALDKTFGEGNNVEKQGVLQTVFGVRGKRAGSLLIRNFKEFDRFVKDISSSSAGHSDRVMKDMMESVQGYIFRVKSAAQNLSIIFADTLEPIVKSVLWLVEGAITGVQWLMKGKFGNFLGPAIAGFTIVKTLQWGYIAISKGIKLINMQMASSMATTATTTVAGYTQMTAAAMGYTAAARTAAFESIRGMGAMGVMGVNKSGAFYRTTSGLTGKAGRRVGSEAAIRYARRFGSAGLATHMAGTGAKTIASRAALPLLGRIAGVLTGPLGLALSFILPGLIGMAVRAIRGNRDATEANTNEQRKASDALTNKRIGAIEFLTDNSAQILMAKRLQMQSLSGQGMTPEGFRRLTDTLGINKRFSDPTYLDMMPTVNIYLDGEQISDTAVVKVQQQLRKEVHNMGF